MHGQSNLIVFIFVFILKNRSRKYSVVTNCGIPYQALQYADSDYLFHCLLIYSFINSGCYMNQLWPFSKTNLSVLATMQSSNPRILKLGDNPGCPCGGTHVSDISEIISMKVISYVLMFDFVLLCLELRRCIFLCFQVKKKAVQFTDFTVLSHFAVSR